MAWLSGFNNRIKLKIDNTKIDGTLLNFPVLIKISNDSGISSLDITSVFIELGSDSNRKKIAVTTSDETTQCYVEIERFDYSNSEAWLWVKVPSISSGAETVLYLYYDSTQADNTAYVGDVGDTPAKNVWDSDFKLVTHMAQDPNNDVTGAIKDSTSNTNHGTPGGSMLTEDLVDGKIGKCIDFDGSNDHINYGISSDFRPPNYLTLETMIKFDGLGTQGIIGNYCNLGYYACLFWYDNNLLKFEVGSLSDWKKEVNTGNVNSTSVWYHLTGVYDGTNVLLYVNGSLQDSGAQTGALSSAVAYPFIIGNVRYDGVNTHSYNKTNLLFGGHIDTTRFSDIARSADWIKATYHSNWDDLITFEIPLDPDDWSNRFKLTIPADSTDSSLTDFPVMLDLSSSSGKTGFDATSVFDDLGNDHQKRMAVTKNDGTTQCQIEIEYWDSTEEKAILWTKVPTVYSSVDTDLYFYWDATTSGNAVYVGDVGDAPAQHVWDSDFKLVMHMAQDPNNDVTDAIKDSTSNANHGTPDGNMTTADLVDGKIGKSIDFDGTDDYINCGSDTSLDDITTKTIEAIINFDTFGEQNGGRIIQKADANVDGWNFLIQGGSGNDRLYFGQDWNNGTFYSWATDTTTLSTTTDHHVVVTYNNGVAAANPLMYIDGESKNVNNPSARVGSSDSDIANDLWIGARNNSGPDREYDGIIDEVRISSTIRSSDWIKATYYSNWDDLIVFQQEDTTTAWLSDWSKRIKLTIDKDKIDSTLTDFPIGITLVSGTHSCVFDELDYVWDGNDDFTGNNGDAPNEDLWAIINNTAAGTVLINANKLRCIVPNTSNDENLGVASDFRMIGDFDIQVDFDLISSNQPSSSYSYPATIRIYFGNKSVLLAVQYPYNTAKRFYFSGTSDVTTYYVTGLSSSKFRFVRSGGIITIYVWDNDQWEWNGSTAGYVCTTEGNEDVFVWLRVYADFDSGATTDFDNFKINSGTVIWPEGSHPNHKKIAMTIFDGTTQCPVEIEQWNFYNKKVNLWTKVPAVDSNEDTILYLYYDKTKDDNTTYVGDTGDAPAQNVWDDNFKLVMHMAQDPSGGADAIKDSTSNTDHGTPDSSMTTTDLVDGKIGKAIDFDGSDDNIAMTIVQPTVYSISVCVKPTSLPVMTAFITSINNYAMDLQYGSDGKVTLQTSTLNTVTSVNTISTGSWEQITGIYDGTNAEIYINSNLEVSAAKVLSTGNSAFLLGRRSDGYFFNGIIDEVQISNIARSAAWIKATYHSNWNELIDFGSEQGIPTHYISGYVKEGNNSVMRQVYLHNKNTGEMMGSTTSNISGYFYINTSYDGAHYVVCLDDTLGTDYNDLIYGNIYPVTISG